MARVPFLFITDVGRCVESVRNILSQLLELIRPKDMVECIFCAEEWLRN